MNPARPKGLRDEVLGQVERMRARWTALDELESMCRLVVLETVVFVPKTADQTRALSAEAASNEMCSMLPLCEELHGTYAVELSVVVEWGGWAGIVVLVGFWLVGGSFSSHHASCVMPGNATKRYRRMRRIEWSE